jgi:hypothetical protein
MTQPWKQTRAWEGDTVAVLATGPSMTAELAESLQQHRTIAVNDAIRVAPWAEMLVALDGNWPQEFRDFGGARLSGIDDETLDAFYIGHRFERVQLTPSHQVEIRNSGLAAIRIAAEMGAVRIILAGFDSPTLPGHFYDDEVDTGEYIGLAAGIAQMTEELRARGVTVERYQAKKRKT